MEFFVDDNRVDSAPDEQGTVAEALCRVQAELCAPGDVIVAVRCDGEEIPGDAMAETRHGEVLP